MGDVFGTGHPDLILAELRAKLLSGELPEAHEDPAEKQARRAVSIMVRWVILLGASFVALTASDNVAAYIAVGAMLALGVVVELWLWSRRRRGVAGENLADQRLNRSPHRDSV